MKNKYILITVFTFILVVTFSVFGFLQTNTNESRFAFKIDSIKESYILGEKVSLNINFTNQTNTQITLQNTFIPEKGYLSLYISQNGKSFKRYLRSDWGKSDVIQAPIKLETNQSINVPIDILWNSKPYLNKKYLAPETIKAATEDKVLTDFVFPDAGDYWIKAKCILILRGETETVQIETKPIKIIINKPAEDELIVWNKIKEKGDIAYFLQNGDIRFHYKKDRKDKLLREINDLIIQHPNSMYSDHFKKNLKKYNEKEKSRDKFKAKYQTPK